jgi:hypothetical protein
VSGRSYSLVPRADRHSLQIPINYRAVGDEEWTPSRVVNISESGVFFGPTELQPGVAVEVIFALPVAVGSRITGPQVCDAKVVRATETRSVAVKFERCRFLLEA